MIPFRYILTGLFGFCFLGAVAQGVDDRAKQKATDKTNSRIDTRIDQGIDKGLNSIEGLFKKKNKKKGNGAEESAKSEEDSNGRSQDTAPPSGGMFGNMFKPAEWKSEYDFGTAITSEVTMTKKNGKQEMSTMKILMGEDAFSVIFEEEGKDAPQVIFDTHNKSFITLMEDKGKRSGMAMAMNEDQLASFAEAGVDESMTQEVSIVKTGRSKKILGYSCDEYTYKDENSEGVIWVTQDLDLSMNEFVGMMSGSTNGKKSILPEGYPEGYAMEMESIDLKSKEKHHYLVTEVNENAGITINTESYKVTDPMGSIGK